MTTVGDIADRLADKTNPLQTPDWDPVGLQLGDLSAEVATLAVCHEVTEDVVASIEDRPCDLLVTYHPLIFNPTTRLLRERSAGGRAFRLVSAGVSLLVTHTDFDAADGGTADALAEVFDLRDTQSFGADDESGLPAIGRVGSFTGTVATVDAIVSDRFGHVGVRVSGDREQPVERVAVVPGSGGSLVFEASGLADVLVTGDVAHHSCVAALDAGLAVVDPGHVATERPGMERLVSLLGDVSGLEVMDLTGLDPQTWS